MEATEAMEASIREDVVTKVDGENFSKKKIIIKSDGERFSNIFFVALKANIFKRYIKHLRTILAVGRVFHMIIALIFR